MSRIEEMVEEMCPDGVEYRRLGDVTVMKRGTSLTKKKAEEGSIPVISGGRLPAFYCNQSNREGETITVAGSGAGAGFVQYWNKPIFACDCFTVKGTEALDTRYVYHWMTSMQDAIYSCKKGGGVPHVHISDIDSFEIPVPPLAVQQEVVRVLDTMTEMTIELTTKLTAELTARTKQYAYYRDELLKLEGIEGVEYVKLGNLSDDGTICLGRGNVISKKYLKDHFGPYPVYSSAQTNDGIIGYCNSYIFDDIRITWSIDGGGKFFYRDGQYSVTNVCGWCKVLREDLIIPKYLYYALSNAWTYKDYNYTHKAHPSTIKEEYIIPVPPLAVQREVVRVLDTMTELTAELTAKLNAELPAREKQYAYYRDMMLDFPHMQS